MQDLSISLQTFQNVIGENRIYVDKTEFVYEVMRTKTYAFLARPRRFGKSLFLVYAARTCGG